MQGVTAKMASYQQLFMNQTLVRAITYGPKATSSTSESGIPCHAFSCGCRGFKWSQQWKQQRKRRKVKLPRIISNLAAEPKSLHYIVDTVSNMHNIYILYVSEMRDPFEFRVFVKILYLLVSATICSSHPCLPYKSLLTANLYVMWESRS